MTTYEVRETTTHADPADRGKLIGQELTFAAAAIIRDRAIAAGRMAFISKVEAR